MGAILLRVTTINGTRRVLKVLTSRYLSDDPVSAHYAHVLHRPAPSPAQLLQQRDQLEQVGDSEVGTPGGYDQGGIIGDQAGPLRRERSELLPVVFEVNPILSPVLSPCDHGELASGMRMERMGNPETFYRTVLIDCSRRRT